MNPTGRQRQSLLDDIFTGGQPLGPASLDATTTRDEAALLFDGNNEVEAVIRRSSPVFLIGRRGSGKTAFLKASANSGSLTADLNSPELIAQVGKTITELDIDTTGEFTERIVPLWDACFTAALCSKIWSNHSGLQRSDCSEAFEFGRIDRKPAGGRSTECAANFLLAVRQERTRLGGDFATVEGLIESTELNGVPLWKARASLRKAANQIGFSGIVSFDSLDQYKGVFYRWGTLVTDSSLALQGLFRAASRVGRDPKSFFKVRVSFPAELWHYFSMLSANPMKDFDNNVLLHWTNKELLHICGTRFLKYLSTNFPGLYRRLDSSRPAHDTLLEYLPSQIINSVGKQEPTLPYLLRHTQLLPRHLIQIFNLIFAEYDLTQGPVGAERIRAAVATAEATIAETVLNSFVLIYPELRSVCEETIPYLHMKLSADDFHRIVNQHRRHGYEYDEVLSMMVEAGILGRYLGSTEIYDRADFEYLHVHRMHITPDDLLCLHPAFARTFDSPDIDIRKRPSGQRPIMPLGSDPNATSEFRRYVRISDSE